MTDGIIQQAFKELLAIINDQYNTNGFKVSNRENDTVVSLPEVNGHINRIAIEIIEKIKQNSYPYYIKCNTTDKDIIGGYLIDIKDLIGDNFL